MMGRRKALQAIGLGAFAAPAAAGQIGHAMHGTMLGGASDPISYPRNAPATAYPQPDELPWERATRALLNPQTLAEVRSQLFADNRQITMLDHDLANKRSFSLAAKITFQRQREVERQIDRMQDGGDNVWTIVENALRKW